MKYKNQFLKEISFPLGGIGTGSIGIDGGGRFTDWEIFNRPSKGSINGNTNIAVRAINAKKTNAAILNGDLQKNFSGQYMRKRGLCGFGYGPDNKQMYGFPHFSEVEFDGEFPIATLFFKDEDFPANIKMTAFNPFIPLDSKNSSIPAAFFEIEVENITDSEIKYQIAFSLTNPYAKSLNIPEEKDGCKMLTFRNGEVSEKCVEYGELTVATDCDNSYIQPYWYRGKWQDSVVTFWNEFSSDKNLLYRTYDNMGTNDTGTVVAEITTKAKEKKKVRFVLSWNVPNYYNYWSHRNDESIRKPWKNYYTSVFENSSETALYSLKNMESLFERTEKFKNALHNSTLPKEVIDAASANLSVLKSPTVLRLEDGSFYGWEGVTEIEGSCEGTCQHVWNYAYALCFLFPELERSIRDLEFKYNTFEDGKMDFRIRLPLGYEPFGFRACVDGQMGAVIKWYREWKISGNNEWLKDNWENIKKIIEYAWSDKNPDCWDLDKDGILEGRGHHTLDMELFGPSSWLEGFYLAALKAGAEMAEFLGDEKKAKEYSELFEKGKAWTAKNLFNGEYFIQKINLKDKNLTDRFEASDIYWNDETEEIKYQIGEGSSIDQLLAQWHADIIGLGEIFDKKQTATALKKMMENNFKPSMRDFVNPWRVFSINSEAGAIICAYPDETKKPKIPVPYCEETMTGFEYSFAGLLCSQEMYDDGFKVVKAIRDRFDGEKRNPWNEFECGNNYARSMASYALIPILSGFEFDMPNNHIGFKPYKEGDFSCVWSLNDAWGNFEIRDNVAKLNIYEGSLQLKSFGAKFFDKIKSVKIDGKEIDFSFDKGKIIFDETKISDCFEIVI